jgi:hypothetical protein
MQKLGPHAFPQIYRLLAHTESQILVDSRGNAFTRLPAYEVYVHLCINRSDEVVLPRAIYSCSAELLLGPLALQVNAVDMDLRLASPQFRHSLFSEFFLLFRWSRAFVTVVSSNSCSLTCLLRKHLVRFIPGIGILAAAKWLGLLSTMYQCEANQVKPISVKPIRCEANPQQRS